MAERHIQKKCIEFCKDNNILALNIHGGGWSNKGLPDLLVFAKSKCVAIELKDENKYHITQAQQIWQKRFKKAGICAYVAHSYEEFTNLLEKENLL